MTGIRARVASVAFPASATVIVAVYILHGVTGIQVPPEVSAALTGLVTWTAIILLGANSKP